MVGVVEVPPVFAAERFTSVTFAVWAVESVPLIAMRLTRTVLLAAPYRQTASPAPVCGTANPTADAA